MSAHIPRLAWGRADGWSGLADGQEWSAAPGTWQARLDPEGRAHVIGREVAAMEQNPDPTRTDAALGSDLYQKIVAGVPPLWYVTAPTPGWARPRRWHAGLNGYDRAMRAARLHNAMVKAAGNG